MKLPFKLLIAIGIVVSGPGLAFAQSSTGTLTITATVTSSIALTFENDAAGVPLTGAGTNSATLALGNISALGTLATTGVTRTIGASDFTVSTPFGLRVNKANSLSTTYTLAAALASADPTNTWVIDATTLTVVNQNLGTSYAYGTAVTHTMALTIPFTASGGAISKIINFTATAN